VALIFADLQEEITMSQGLRAVCFVLSMALLISSATAKPPTVTPIPLSPDDLANHFGITYMSFEMTFDDPPDSVTFAIDVYKDGKRISEGEAMPSTPIEKVRKHKCTVMFSHLHDNDQLQCTVVTSDGTLHSRIANPFDKPGIITRRTARPDAQGRILVAGMLPDRPGVPRHAGDLSIDSAAKALVIQVTQKVKAK
jgi:hypothetical protein